MPEERSATEPRDRRIPTVSAKLTDGTLVEMLLRKDIPESKLLVWKDGVSEEVDRLPISSGAVLMPYRCDNNLLTHGVVLLPSALGELRSEEELFDDVRAFIHRYVDVSEHFELLATQYVLLSWVYDAFNELPYLRVRGDYGSGKSRFLQTVGSLCYKPIFASGASTVSPLFRILDAVEGTLIIDEADFRVSDERAEVVKILNNGNARGFPLLRSEQTPQREFNPRAFRVFGPKLVATRRHFEDQALESRCLTEELGTRRLRSDIPITLPRSFGKEAEALRNSLLRYRFTHVRDRSVPPLPPHLEPRLAQVLLPLFATARAPRAREALLALAGSLGRTLSARRSASLEAELLAVMLAVRTESRVLSLRALADALGARLGEPIAPRRVGWLLRARLFLSPIRREGVYVVPEEEMAKLDVLAERYGVAEAPADDDVGDVGEDA